VSFFRVQGQRRATKILEGLLSSERIPSAMLFSGLEGTGKTLMAREFAKALLCQEKKSPAEPCGLCSDCAAIDKGLHPDVKIVDASYQAGLVEGEVAKQKILQADTLRHLRRDMEMQSMLGRWKVAIVCDAHTMTDAAANVLLKNLEEPQPQTLWILVSAQKGRMLKTIMSRCFSVTFSPLTPEIVKALLVEREMPAPQAARLSALAGGSVSRALELAQAGDYPDSLHAGPMAALEAADSLPKELYLARTQVELALFALAQDIRLKHLRGETSFYKAEKPLRELGVLRQALRSNADPRTVLLLAALETEGI
jgi:DNA polymerase III delta' subunit